MDKLKRLFVDYRHQVLIATEIIILIAGAFVAYLTVYRYGLIVRAVLGIVINYLLYLEYVVFRRIHDKSVFFDKFEFPKDVKYFVMDFFLVILMIWGGVQVLDLIRYLIHIFINR